MNKEKIQGHLKSVSEKYADKCKWHSSAMTALREMLKYHEKMAMKWQARYIKAVEAEKLEEDAKP